MSSTESERPFSIKWWLAVYKKCAGRSLGHYTMGDSKGTTRWTKKLHWVEQRIITKFKAKRSK